jgi:hypothetical protein
LLLQIGCQEQAGVAGKPKTVVAEPKRGVRQVTAKRTQPVARRPGPRIKFEKVICDLGEISPGAKNDCEFKFTNVGDRVLKIRKIGKTCGCTAPKLTKREYAPGESGMLTVVYRAQSTPGAVSKRL